MTHRRSLLLCAVLMLLAACHHTPPSTTRPGVEPPPVAAPAEKPRPAAAPAPSAGGRWITYQPPDGSFTVDFPFGGPAVRQVTLGRVTRTDYSVYAPQASLTFMVEVFEHDPRYRIANASDLLRSYPNPRAAGINGQVVSEAPLQQGNYPGREVRIEGTVNDVPGPVVHLYRAFVTDGRLYVVTSSAGPGFSLSPYTQRFLDSFRILKSDAVSSAPPPIPARALVADTWVPYTAPDGSFTVDFPLTAPAVRQLQHDAIARTDYATYDHDISATFIVQVFENEARYRVANASDLLRSYPNPGSSGIDGRVVSETPLRQGNYPGREVRIEGTVSAGPGLVIHVSRAFVADGRMYVVTSSAGPGSPLSPYTQRFLDSFRILR